MYADYPKPTDHEFALYQELIKRRLGIFLPSHKKPLLCNRLNKRLFARQVDDFGSYFQLINHIDEESELKLALELITTNETYFFREPKHFDYLQREVLRQHNGLSKFRVWSAASSSGEEPYSIAMLLDDRCKGPWEIMASDINSQMLDHAGEGIYIDSRTKGIPSEYRQRYCLKGIGKFEGQLRIIPKIRQSVSFKKINLIESMPDIGLFDLIFLRNVMIYFDRDTQVDVLNNVRRSLKPDGLLYLSHSESLQGVSDDFLLVKPAIYRIANSRQ